MQHNLGFAEWDDWHSDTGQGGEVTTVRSDKQEFRLELLGLGLLEHEALRRK